MFLKAIINASLHLYLVQEEVTESSLICQVSMTGNNQLKSKLNTPRVNITNSVICLESN